MAAEKPRSSRAPASSAANDRAKVETLAPYLSFLSPSSRDALARANGFRLAMDADRIHMEHLLTGLLMKPTGPAESAFLECDITAEQVIATLRRRDKHAPELGGSSAGHFAFRVTEHAIDTSTPLSRHVGEALGAAFERARRYGEPPRMQSRDLLLGMGAVKSCSVVRAFGTVFERAPSIVATLPKYTNANAPNNREPSKADEASLGRGRGAGNDRPEQADDRLEFKYYIKAFADLVESPDTRPPITIGIFGSWGAGKSFLLWHLQEELRRRERKRRRSLADALADRPLRESPRLMMRHGKDSVARAFATSSAFVVDAPREAAERLRARWRGHPVLEPADREVRHIHSVVFNAWEYNATELIWPRLVRAILENAESNARGLSRVALALARFGRRLRRASRGRWTALLTWGLLSAVLVSLVLQIPQNKLPDALEQMFGFATGKEFVLPAAVGALVAFAKLLADSFVSPLGSWMTALLDDAPAYGGQIDYMQAIKDDLDRLQRRLAKKHARVLVMIDDLDRCEPKKMVEVLQAVNLLLDRGSFIVCLGLDTRIVTAAVENHYEDLLASSGMTGYEYLDKIIQIPFRIPDPTHEQLAELLAGHLGQPREMQRRWKEEAADERHEAAADAPATSEGVTEPKAAAAAPPPTAPTPVTDAPSTAPTAEQRDGPLTFSDEEIRAFTSVTSYLRPNPRHIKRLVNVYALVRSLSTSRGDIDRIGRPGTIVRWLVIAAQWPYTLRQMLDRLDELLRETPPPADGSPWRPANVDNHEAPLSTLLRAVALDERHQKRHDWENGRLIALVQDSGGVTWDQLRLLRRYTLNFNPALEAELQAEDAKASPADRRKNPRKRGATAKGGSMAAPASDRSTPNPPQITA